MADELDRLFAAFRRTRDPELLAALFEQTAPWLLHRARRLLGGAALAEDVVQDLFLALLENGHGCEPGRPCRPYLLGILQHRAARVRRQQARTLAQSLRAATSASATPSEAAIGAEQRAAVRGAIDALPEPYREVVRRFVRDEPPTAISRALGRTPNAVRVQLHRGLRLLRTAMPPGLLLLLCTLPARPAPAQALRPRPLRLAGAALLACALAAWVGIGKGHGTTAPARATGEAASVPPLPATSEGSDAPAAAPPRTALATAAAGALVLELRHADGSPAPSVGVVAHQAGRDPDFGAVCAVSGADGRVVLPDLPLGPVTVAIDRGVRLAWQVQPDHAAPCVVALPAGVDVAGTVRDADGRPAADAGIWLRVLPMDGAARGAVVARTGADGRFALRGVRPRSVLAAVREGSVPSPLQTVAPHEGGQGGELELVLGGAGASIAGRVLDHAGAPVAGAVVRIGRHPRANFLLPGGGGTVEQHPSAIARTDGDGAFALADLLPGPMQVLVRAPQHRTALEPLVLAPGVEQRLELRLRTGAGLAGVVHDEGGAPVAEATVFAHGPVRNEWAAVWTAPDGSFALAGLDTEGVTLAVDAPGFAPVSRPVAAGSGPIRIALQAEPRRVLRLQDAAGAAAGATGWELAAYSRGAAPAAEVLAPSGDGFAAGGELAKGPFLVRRQGTWFWLRAEPAADDPDLLRLPAAAARVGPLRLLLPGTTPEQRRGLVLVLDRDGVPQAADPDDPAAAVLDFGSVPVGAYRAQLCSHAGLLPTVDLGAIAVGEADAPRTVALPAHGWLRYRLQRSDRVPLLECTAFAAGEDGQRLPLPGAGGRVALVPGRYRLWASSLSFPTVRGHSFEIAAGQETSLDLEVPPGKVRHLAFRLPPGTDPQGFRATVLPAGGREGEDAIPLALGGFDAIVDGFCCTPLVLADGSYRLEVECGHGTFRSPFDVAGDLGVAEPIEVALLAADR